jgi:Rab guanine nucleotide exchange factor SEC2
MVAAAKQEREAVEKKNEQLRAQIQDTEALVASQLEQLAELKTVMQDMNFSRDENETTPNQSTAPSSPAIAMQANLGRLLDSSNLSPVTVAVDITPAPSTSFPHLIKPVYRVDMVAYEDFRELLNFAKASKPPSRVASGSYGGLNVMGLAGLTSSSSNTNGGTQSLTPQSQTPNGSPQPNVVHTPLKDTRFYKRILIEDFEPTLRLDAAPSISWLTRRSVFSSLCDGSLIVEPMPASHRKYKFPCSLCGERRTDDTNERTHRFRTSDSESAQRYSLCILCLEKIRACCDFAGYLRMILDGYVHVGDVEEEKEAWEETIRLRERVFWSRFGGGVVPSFISTDDSDKVSPVTDSAAEAESNATESKTETEVQSPTPGSTAKVVAKTPPALPPRNGNVEAISIDSDVKTASVIETEEEAVIKEENNTDADKQLHTDLETALPDASHSNAATDVPVTPITETAQQFNDHDSESNDSDNAKTVPGAFD